MSSQVPARISKDVFRNAILNKISNKKYENLGYKDIIDSSYIYNEDTNEYTFKDDISTEVLAKLDFILKRIGYIQFEIVSDISVYFRELLNLKKYILVFAYNGTGKTRLSCAFKDLGKRPIPDSEEKTADTLYYNAFTEDLFIWDNDLENDTQRVLRLNSDSRFFGGLRELEMESRIRPLLSRYADFDFTIDYDNWNIIFSREIRTDVTTERIEYIKVSRGEENIFVWCFFLAVVQLAIDKESSYDWVKYIYVDDPISSLDDNNVITVASHLAQLLKNQSDIKVVISSHHTLFFNVLCNEIQKAEKYFLQKNAASGEYIIRDTGDTPFFNHVALLKELKKVADSGNLYTYHFNILRNILEKTASFHGFENFSSCIKQANDDLEGTIHTRMINLLSHGNYSLFDPREMLDDNKEHFRKILTDFMETYKFNHKLFSEE